VWVGVWPSRASSGFAISARMPSNRTGLSASIFATSVIASDVTIEASVVAASLRVNVFVTNGA
jgi:hypothetical protein